jgi:hypothetical protein
VAHPYGCRLLLFLLKAVITVCGGCKGGGEAGDETNIGEDEAGRDKREVYRGAYQGR